MGQCPSAIPRWRDSGRWEKLLEILADSPDFEWLMIIVAVCLKIV